MELQTSMDFFSNVLNCLNQVQLWGTFECYPQHMYCLVLNRMETFQVEVFFKNIFDFYNAPLPDPNNHASYYRFHIWFDDLLETIKTALKTSSTLKIKKIDRSHRLQISSATCQQWSELDVNAIRIEDINIHYLNIDNASVLFSKLKWSPNETDLLVNKSCFAPITLMTFTHALCISSTEFQRVMTHLALIDNYSLNIRIHENRIEFSECEPREGGKCMTNLKGEFVSPSCILTEQEQKNILLQNPQAPLLLRWQNQQPLQLRCPIRQMYFMHFAKSVSDRVIIGLSETEQRILFYFPLQGYGVLNYEDDAISTDDALRYSVKAINF